MNRISLGYSTKNIPVQGRREYLTEFILNQEAVARRIRWKAFFSLDPGAQKSQVEHYGFKSLATPPLPNHPLKRKIIAFERDFFSLASHIKFRRHDNELQTQLRADLAKIKEQDKIIVKSDKTSNYHAMEVDDYKDLKREAICAEYIRCQESEVESVNKEAAKIASKLQIDDRVECLSTAECFITYKDHKPFRSGKPQVRLLNGAKSQLGKISSQILQRSNANIRSATGVQQWRKTRDVLDWFEKISDKKGYKFFQFDIVSFYPNISRDNLKKAIEWARKFTSITEEEEKIIFHSRESFLFNEGRPWKKAGGDRFDVTMGSFDGAECCELIGLHILHTIVEEQKLFKKGEVGLYRDDGLAVVKGTPRSVAALRKKMEAVFGNMGFQITCEHSQPTTQFLDVELDLPSGLYRPWRKPNDTPSYIHVDSNHPPCVIKQIPDMIADRLSTNSSNEQIFSEAAVPYNEALQKSGYKSKLVFKPRGEKKKKNRRSRAVIWWNPPYNSAVSNKIAKTFFELVDKHFKGTKLAKVFNRGNMKVSYRTGRNIKNHIDGHNKAKLRGETTSTAVRCNCTREPCPVQGSCGSSNLIYRADVVSVEANNNTKTMSYYGQTTRAFKIRFGEHKNTFNTPKKILNRRGGAASIADQIEEKKNKSELAAHVWGLKKQKKNFNITWRIERRALPYKIGAKNCNLCANEKTCIALGDPDTTLNRRNEIFHKCRNRTKYLLKNFMPP